MKILRSDMYLDGGTILIETDEGDYSIDYRIHTNTEGKVYRGYPEDDNSNLIENQKEIIKKLKEACNEPSTDKYIKDIINKLN